MKTFKQYTDPSRSDYDVKAGQDHMKKVLKQRYDAIKHVQDVFDKIRRTKEAKDRGE